MTEQAAEDWDAARPDPRRPARLQRLTGHGPPRIDANTGDRYTDLSSGEIYSLNKTGWSNRTRIQAHPTIRQKNAWTRAAREAGMNLERWIFKSLDAAARHSERGKDRPGRQRFPIPND